MAKNKDQFLRHLERRRERAASRSVPSTEKPLEQLTDDELEEALTQARRALLDAQRQELREREQARVQAPPGTLADVLREKQRGKRRTWR